MVLNVAFVFFLSVSALADDCELNILSLESLVSKFNQNEPMSTFQTEAFPKSRRVQTYKFIWTDAALFQHTNEPAMVSKDSAEFKKILEQIVHDPEFIKAPAQFMLNWGRHRNQSKPSKAETLAFDFLINQTKKGNLRALAYVAGNNVVYPPLPSFSVSRWARRVQN